MPISTALLFALLSLVFGAFSARDYLRNDHHLSLAARTWLRIAVIFAVVALLLTFVV
jgi:hypothetical protein